ncbi:MAG: MoaD/ThiS family protein [Oscillospiraceae bacterium]|jgi:molybdopterin converting factor small subunit|nr:MoaD/ThiS family protein [Oscillospiraceae bacterium]
MARVQVHYRAALAELTGKTEETVDAATVRGVLGHIKKAYGAGALRAAKRMLVAVDNDSILLHKGFDTKLADGMSVRFLPICGGG